ncbi:MAG: hypothetical protein ACOX4C_11730 [Bacillota bacterium]|jgi:hypothetical protein|nr:hypothetical protein [Bacillota bacterium]MDD4336045.1 hypothetical protein [Bacillota bacterium]MDD4792667.1 hypothetical protein [Bacillota bacterium]
MQMDHGSKLQQEPNRRRIRTAFGLAILLIVLVIAVFSAVGEMIFRHGAVPMPEGAESGQVSSVRLRDLDGEFEVVAIDVGRVQGMRPALDLGISFWAQTADFEITLLGPGGSVMWQEDFSARMARVSAPKISFEATSRGQWRLILNGRARNLMLSVAWKIEE